MKRMTMRLLSVTALFLAQAVTTVSCSKRQPLDGTLRLPLEADAKSLDPALISDLYSAIPITMSYEGLLEYHYLKRPHELTPLLAEAMPKVSPDGLTYTFKLRQGVKFIDHAAFAGGRGRALKAKDFVYSWLRVADPKLNSPTFWVFDGRIVGLNEWREKQKSAAADYDHPPAGFQALDDSTLQIKLTRKYPQLLYVLAMANTVAVAREVVEQSGSQFGNILVGTGPYKLTSWMRNSKMIFERNAGFRGQAYPSEGEKGDAEKGLLADAGKTMPFADKVEYGVFVERQPMWLNFLKGALDLVETIPADNFDAVVDRATQELKPDYVEKHILLSKAPQSDTGYTAFNLEDPIIKKGGANLRKALSLAIDQKRVTDLFYNGRAVLANFILPPPIAGYDAAYVNPFTQYNVAKAKECLAKAGFPGGQGLPELTLEVNQGSTMRQQAEFMQKQWAAIGVKVRVNISQFSELDEKISKKRAQIWSIAWNADYPDAENFLQLLYGPNRAPGPNGSNFDDPEYNKLYEQVRDMADSPARRALIQKMQAVFEREMPWIPERHRLRFAVMREWLKNYKPEYMGSSVAKFLRVDIEAKKKGIN